MLERDEIAVRVAERFVSGATIDVGDAETMARWGPEIAAASFLVAEEMVKASKSQRVDWLKTLNINEEDMDERA